MWSYSASAVWRWLTGKSYTWHQCLIRYWHIQMWLRALSAVCIYTSVVFTDRHAQAYTQERTHTHTHAHAHTSKTRRTHTRRHARTLARIYIKSRHMQPPKKKTLSSKSTSTHQFVVYARVKAKAEERGTKTETKGYDSFSQKELEKNQSSNRKRQSKQALISRIQNRNRGKIECTHMSNCT